MIRQATLTNLDQMLKIGKSVTIDNSKVDDPIYAAKVQQRGFIPEGFATEKNFREELEVGDVSIVYEQDSQTQGFCTVRKEIYYPEDLKAVIWIDHKAKKSYYHGKSSRVISYLLLDPNSLRRGIGTKLFDEAVGRARKKGFTDFFWITTLAPLTNTASMNFITKQGFKRANFTMPNNLFGLKNQQSVLYWRSFA